MALPRLIGLYSPAHGSGKSTVASHFSGFNYVTIPFAGVLKHLTVELLKALGYSPLEASTLVLKTKDTRIPRINTTPRHMMQTLGTEYGRQCIHPDLWLFCWEAQVNQAFNAGHNVIVDDVRFVNEAELIRDLGGDLWYIYRPSATVTNPHASVGGLDDYQYFSRRFENTGTIVDLQLAVTQSLSALILNLPE